MSEKSREFTVEELLWKGLAGTMRTGVDGVTDQRNKNGNSHRL